MTQRGGWIWITTCPLPDLHGTLKNKDIELHGLKTTHPEIIGAFRELQGVDSAENGTSLVAQLVKESTCNAGNPGWIPGSGRSPGEGIGYPLQYS